MLQESPCIRVHVSLSLGAIILCGGQVAAWAATRRRCRLGRTKCCCSAWCGSWRKWCRRTGSSASRRGQQCAAAPGRRANRPRRSIRIAGRWPVWRRVWPQSRDRADAVVCLRLRRAAPCAGVRRADVRAAGRPSDRRPRRRRATPSAGGRRIAPTCCRSPNRCWPPGSGVFRPCSRSATRC